MGGKLANRRGRVVAEWKHAVKRGVLTVTVQPLSRWSPRVLADVRREAAAVS